MKAAVFLLFVFLSSPGFSALSPEAQGYLNKIPGRTVNLPFVIKTAIENAEAYKVIGLDKARAELEELSTIGAQTDTYLTAGGQYADDNTQKTNPFSPIRAKQWEWNMNVNKTWVTGTKASVGWIYDTSEFQFDPLVAAQFGGGFLTNFKQSTALISLEQSLLKDSFGYGMRKQKQATRLRGKAIDLGVRDQMEKLTLEFIGQFYNAWLMQQQVRSLQDQVKRRGKLLRILTQRSKKGVVEKPELLQVEALLSGTKAQLAAAESGLGNIWQNLVVSLKLPDKFLAENPMDIPTVIDMPVIQALDLCKKAEPQKTAELAALENQVRALELDFDQAKNASLPDLKLIAGYRGNSIDESASVTMQNVLQGRDDDGFGIGPAWNAGLQLNWPLDNSAAKAQRIQKYVEKEQTQARLQMAKDGLKNQWADLCRRLKAEWKTSRDYDKVVQGQKKRVKAEDRRFRLGRIRVDQLVNAEDDLGQWEFNSQQKAIEVRQIAWQVQQLSGSLFAWLRPYTSHLSEEKL